MLLPTVYKILYGTHGYMLEINGEGWEDTG